MSKQKRSRKPKPLDQTKLNRRLQREARLESANKVSFTTKVYRDKTKYHRPSKKQEPYDW